MGKYDSIRPPAGIQTQNSGHIKTFVNTIGEQDDAFYSLVITKTVLKRRQMPMPINDSGPRDNEYFSNLSNHLSGAGGRNIKTENQNKQSHCSSKMRFCKILKNATSLGVNKALRQNVRNIISKSALETASPQADSACKTPKQPQPQVGWFLDSGSINMESKEARLCMLKSENEKQFFITYLIIQNHGGFKRSKYLLNLKCQKTKKR